MPRVGILGGTFNPPHNGHVAIATAAADALALDRVVWMPVAIPPLKEAEGDPGPEVRLELTRLATADDPRFEVSDLEVERGGTSYTVATLKALHDQRPEDDLIFIAGADAAKGLPAWQGPEAVLELATLAVAERADQAKREHVLEALRALPGAEERVVFFELPAVPVSSTLVRAAAAAGEPLDALVPPAVADAIASRDLYRGGGQQ